MNKTPDEKYQEIMDRIDDVKRLANRRLKNKAGLLAQCDCYISGADGGFAHGWAFSTCLNVYGYQATATDDIYITEIRFGETDIRPEMKKEDVDVISDYVRWLNEPETD